MSRLRKYVSDEKPKDNSEVEDEFDWEAEMEYLKGQSSQLEVEKQSPKQKKTTTIKR